jgi:hypothetical protein
LCHAAKVAIKKETDKSVKGEYEMGDGEKERKMKIFCHPFLLRNV